MPDRFQPAMIEAIDGNPVPLEPWLPGADLVPLDVYRNTIARGWIKALEGLFPTVARLVGEDWFSDAAMIFARAHPPSGPVLDEYGLDFPGWLVRFPPAAELGYLAPIARLDLAWSLAHRAQDSPILSVGQISTLATGSLLAARLQLHPSACLFNFAWTAPSIWLANRDVPGARGEPVWENVPEALAVFRPQWTVQARRLDAAEWRFLEGCKLGRTVGQSVLLAMGSESWLDPGRFVSRLVQAGLFTQLEPRSP